MKVNVGSTDRMIRLVLAVVFFIVAFSASGTTFKVIMGVLGVVMLGTALMRSCPLYLPFGISTCTKK